MSSLDAYKGVYILVIDNQDCTAVKMATEAFYSASIFALFALIRVQFCSRHQTCDLWEATVAQLD